MTRKRLAGLVFLAAALPALGQNELVPVDTPAPRKTAGTFCALPGQDVPGVVVPDGFCFRKFANVPTPRVMAFAPNGDLFVSSPKDQTPGGAPPGLGAILVLPDDDKDGSADGVLTYTQAANLSSVHGLAFRSGELLYTVDTGVFSVPYAFGDRALAATAARTQLADLSDRGISDRWTKAVAVATDGSVFVSRGQYDNDVCPVGNARGGAVLRVGPGHDPHGDVVVRGLRDSLFLRCEPWGKCYGAELSGDGWEGLGGEEKLFELVDGDDLGYPCCINRNVPNPSVTPKPDCSKIGVTVLPFTLHDTPFGFDWEKGKWPEPYRGGLFVGLHGVFFSWVHTGLEWAPTDPATHRPLRTTTPFLTGFGRNAPINGRVGDTQFAPDGRLFIADDQGGAIYWIAPKSLRVPAR